jgi:hypothetical protein
VSLTAGGELETLGPVAPINYGNCAVFLAPNQTLSGTDLLTLILSPVGMNLVAGRDGKLRALVMAALPGAPTIKAALDAHNIVSITPMPLPAGIDPPPYRMRVGYNDNYTVQTTDLSPLTTPTRAQYLATPGSVSQVNSTLTSTIVRPNDPPVIRGSIVPGQSAAAASVAFLSATRAAALWGVRRRTYGFELPFSVGITLDYGDVVSITTEIGDLSGTKKGMVVGYSYRTGAATMTVYVLV